MAQVELCTDSGAGPYLLAAEGVAAGLKARFDGSAIPCALARAAIEGDGGSGPWMIQFRVGANLAVISEALNQGEYDWELAGW